MDQLNQLTIFLASILTLALTPAQVEAQQVPNCLNLYNGGPSCKSSDLISVDKKIQSPENGDFVELIEPNEARIQPGNSVIFRVTITNKSTRKLEDIAFRDELPDSLTFKDSQKGTYNVSQGVLTYSIESLDVEKSETFDIQTQIKPEAELKASTGPLCITNFVSVKTGAEEATDNVQFCLQNEATSTSTDQTFPAGSTAQPTPIKPATGSTTKGGLATTKGGKPVLSPPTTSKSPDTGPELLALVGLIPTGLAGFYLRKKSKI